MGKNRPGARSIEMFLHILETQQIQQPSRPWYVMCKSVGQERRPLEAFNRQWLNAQIGFLGLKKEIMLVLWLCTAYGLFALKLTDLLCPSHVRASRQEVLEVQARHVSNKDHCGQILEFVSANLVANHWVACGDQRSCARPGYFSEKSSHLHEVLEK